MVFVHYRVCPLDLALVSIFPPTARASDSRNTDNFLKTREGIGRRNAQWIGCNLPCQLQLNVTDRRDDDDRSQGAIAKLIRPPIVEFNVGSNRLEHNCNRENPSRRQPPIPTTCG